MENPVPEEPKFRNGDNVFVTCGWPVPSTREHIYDGARIRLESINGRGEWTGTLDGGIRREVVIPNPPGDHIKLLPPKMK